MDQAQLQQKIAEYYVKLPEDLKVFFAEQNWLTNLQKMSVKYKLTPDQISTLTTETTLLLLCIINIADYAIAIEKELNLEEDIFQQVLNDISENILKTTYGKIEEGYLNNLETLEKENAIEMQDVPLPPYKKVITNDQLLINNVKEETMPLNTENDLKSDMTEQTLIDQTKKDVNFLAQKLSKPTVTQITVSDHSLPTLNKQPNPLTKNHDPYREGI